VIFLILQFKSRPHVEEAEAILRNCVHCGFCTATCPTYQLLGDELDGPRGRIYLIKQLLEGKDVSEKTQLHPDRCLSCRSCETTCPSGVKYGRLADIGKEILEHNVRRSLADTGQRRCIRKVLPYPARFRFATNVVRSAKFLLSRKLAAKIPHLVKHGETVAQVSTRKMLALDG